MSRSSFPILFFFLVSILACQPTTNNAAQEMTELKKQVVQLQQDLATTKSTRSTSKSKLVHVVLLDLKEESFEEGKQKIIAAIEQLPKIETVQDLEIGSFADLKDKRALSSFELVMTMAFDDETAYKTYQAHPIHLQLKEVARKYLAKPPTTYDFYTDPKQ